MAFMGPSGLATYVWGLWISYLQKSDLVDVNSHLIKPIKWTFKVENFIKTFHCMASLQITNNV